MPSGWSPNDGITSLLFGGSAIVGLLVIVGKMLIFGIVIVSSAKTDAGSYLNFFTIAVSSFITFWIVRIFGIDGSAASILLLPNPTSPMPLIWITLITSALVFSVVEIAVRIAKEVSGVVALLMLSVSYGILTTVLAMSLAPVFTVEQPFSYVILFVGIGVFIGCALYGLYLLLREALREESVK